MAFAFTKYFVWNYEHHPSAWRESVGTLDEKPDAFDSVNQLEPWLFAEFCLIKYVKYVRIGGIRNARLNKQTKRTRAFRMMCDAEAYRARHTNAMPVL